MKIILTGATGFVGTEVLREALERPSVEQVTVLTRRATGAAHGKVKELVVPDFTDYAQVGDALGADACVWCLGVSQAAVSREEYVRITVDYATSAARAMLAVNPKLRFCFVSGRNADRTEQNGALNRRVKGRAERELVEIGGDNVFCFRPAFIREAYPGQPRPWIVKAFKPFASIVDLFTDGYSVGCADLARALLDVAENGAGEQLIENAALKRWGQPAASKADG
jgi:uncharacterized protein YbjT (DUF2867 family)